MFWANCSFTHLSWANWANRSGRSFVMRDLINLLTVAHLSWVTGAICSQSLIPSPDEITHSETYSQLQCILRQTEEFKHVKSTSIRVYSAWILSSLLERSPFPSILRFPFISPRSHAALQDHFVGWDTGFEPQARCQWTFSLTPTSIC